MSFMIDVAESGYVPDVLLRAGIRRLLRQRLRSAAAADGESIVSRMNDAPIAIETDQANDQHYEVPAEFFRLMLGPRLKYSSCDWSGAENLARAEDRMLALTCERSQLSDGMSVLDLGCGWGSLSLWIAERFPRCRVTAVSNSTSQQEYIRERARHSGLNNVEVLCADVNRLEPRGKFDRVMSIEMFEHMRNYDRLLSRIAGWLADEGRLFVHIFCHRRHAYFFEDDGPNDWMAQNFFSGGLMPSWDLLKRFDNELVVTDRWAVNGTHYSRTLLAWLERIDSRKDDALRILARHHGAQEAQRQLVRWRLFLLACAELFGYRKGEEWMVGHYLLQRTTG